jgi:hypothetical protein
MQSLCVEEGIYLHLTADEQLKHCVDELLVRGDAIQFADPEFRKELAFWIGKGVFGTSWLMSKLAKLAVTYIDLGKSQGERDSSVLLSSPVLGVVSSAQNTRLDQVLAGQVYQRICLLAAAYGVWTQPLSQIVQIPQLQQRLAELLPVGDATPLHPFRMGFAVPEKKHTPRLPLGEVLQP